MGTENSLLLSYFSVFARSKPKSYITPNFKKSNQNLMLPKYLNKNQSNQIEWKKEKLTGGSSLNVCLLPIYVSQGLFFPPSLSLDRKHRC